MDHMSIIMEISTLENAIGFVGIVMGMVFFFFLSFLFSCSSVSLSLSFIFFFRKQKKWNYKYLILTKNFWILKLAPCLEEKEEKTARETSFVPTFFVFFFCLKCATVCLAVKRSMTIVVCAEGITRRVKVKKTICQMDSHVH